MFDFITVCKPEREIDATTRKATSDQKLWLGRRGGKPETCFPDAMPAKPCFTTPTPSFCGDLSTAQLHKPSAPLGRWECHGLPGPGLLLPGAGAEPGSGPLDIAV